MIARARIVPFAFLAIACADASASDGSGGYAGWVDASGAPIRAVADGGAGLRHFDDRGLVWNIDVRSGVSSLGALNPGTAGLSLFVRIFTSADCTGEAFIDNAPLPRYTFKIRGDETILVRPDALQEMMVSVCSDENEPGACRQLSPCEDRRTIPFAPTRPSPGIETPAPRPAPLHPVWFEN